MNTYPGAIWRPTADKGAMDADPDVTSLHIAVTRAEKSVLGWQQSAIACHAYNGRDGYFEQYVPFNRKVSGVADGNGHVVTIESFDGLQILQNPYREIGLGGVYGDDADSGRWDAGQLERAADLLAWQHLEYGLELRVMQTSRRGEHGVAPHRLGIAPWRVADGEVWTRHDGKRCPGDQRVLQIPGIVARAQVIADAVKAGVCTWLPTGVVDVPTALARTNSSTKPPAGSTGGNTPPEDDDMGLTPEQAADLKFVADALRQTVGEGQKPDPGAPGTPGPRIPGALSGYAKTQRAILDNLQKISQDTDYLRGQSK